VAAAERSGGSCWNSGFEGGGGLFFSVFVSIPPLLLLRSPLSLFFFFLLPPLFSPVFFSAAFDSFSLHSSFLSKITCGFLPFILPFLSQKNNCLSLGLCLSPHSLIVSVFFFFGPPPLFSAVFSSFLSSFRVTIYRGRGSGVDPAPSHRCPCMGRTSPALLRCRPRWPMEASLAGHGCSGISS